MKNSDERSKLSVLFDQLRILFPVSGLLHVGAGGNAKNLPYINWKIENALLIEAEENLYQKLATDVKSYLGWYVLNLLIGGENRDRKFYVASNPNESGVIPPEELQGIWRNLRTHEIKVLPCTRFESLSLPAGLRGTGRTSFNWAFIDCLPALPVLQGAGALLEELDVIVVRVLGDGLLPSSFAASCKDVSEFMSERCFRYVAAEQQLHPAVAMHVFIRDWKALFVDRHSVEQEAILHLKQSVDGQVDLLLERQIQIEDLSLLLQHQTDQSDQLAQELHLHITQKEGQIERLSEQEKALQGQLLTARSQTAAKEGELAQLRKQILHLKKSVDEQVDLLNERQEQIEDLSLSLQHQTDQSGQLAQELRRHVTQKEGQIERLSEQEKALRAQLLTARNQTAAKEGELAQLRKQILYLKSSVEEQVDLLNERQKQIEDLSLSLQHQTEQSAQAANELQQQILQLEAGTTGLNAQLSGLQAEVLAAQSEIAVKEVALTEQCRQTEFWHQQVEKLKVQSDTYAQRIEVLEPRIDEQENIISVQRESYASLSADYGAQTNQLREQLSQMDKLTQTTEVQAQRIAQLERERVEIDGRQSLLNQEIIKAEAQIELIKDVVLREKTF